MSAASLLLNSLKRGALLTKQDIERTFGLLNVSATISRLRQQGNPIYSNARKVNGMTTRYYRYGTPKRREVALGRAVVTATKKVGITDPVYSKLLADRVQKILRSR